MLAWEVDLWVYYAHVPGKRIIARERLLLDAESTPDFLLANIVNGVLMPREVIRPREDSIAGFASRRIDALALVRARLRVSSRESR